MTFAEDADPRFSFSGAQDKDRKDHKRRAPSDGSLSVGEKKRARIAFTGEEWGFGYQATREFLSRARERKTVPDGGLSSIGVEIEREIEAATKNNRFDYDHAVTQPLRTKEQSLMALKQGVADFAIVPFYHPYTGYDFETLRSMSGLSTMLGVEQIEATDRLCLAVHESQLFDIIQSSHPGTGFSALQRRMRKSWGLVDSDSGNRPEADFAAEMPRAGLPIDMADQKLIRDRIDVVFAGPEAIHRCKSKLDGLKAIGVEVREIPQMIEPHRELARIARSSINTARQTNTMFDPVTGNTQFVSTLGADTQASSLYGMVLPYEVAMRSSDYVIIDDNIDDAPPTKTRFMVVENNPDPTLFEDKYRTTDAKTAFWVKRLQNIARPQMDLPAGLMRFAGYGAASIAIALVSLGAFGLYHSMPFPMSNLEALPSWLSQLTAGGALAVGGAIAALAWVLLSVQSRGRNGVRVLLRILRDGGAASLGDVENFLRNYGVRHSLVRMGEDSENDKPAPVVLDIEFMPDDFAYGPFAMLSRRQRGSVVNGALKKVIQRWKNSGVTVLAAMPFDKPQLPHHQPRRWWKEGLSAWFADAAETWFIRLSRVLMFYVIPAALVVFLIIRLMSCS